MHRNSGLSLECEYAYYLNLPKDLSDPVGNLFKMMGTWILIFCNFVPISLMVSLEIVKLA